MLVIRDAQMTVFEDEALYRWVVAYLQSAYPAQFTQMGAGNAGDLVRDAIEDAWARGVTDAAAVRKYAHVAFLLGPEFLTQHEWARRIMGSRRFKHEVVRMRALEDAAARYLSNSPAPAVLE